MVYIGMKIRSQKLEAKMESLKKIKAEKITVTLTLGEVDELMKAGRICLQYYQEHVNSYLVYALQKLDAAVNV